MATVTPARLVEALADWGCTPTPYQPDNRPWHSHTTAGGWDPIGVLHHHTGGSSRLLTDRSSQSGMLRMLRAGRPDLDGPLCHLAPAMIPGQRAARVWLIGWGNTNHAGLGSATAAALLRVGKYTARRPGPDAVDGNEILWGLEYLHPGVASVDWPDELLDVGHRAGAAICQAQGWSRESWPGSQLEHRQWTRRKIDRSWPGNLQTAIRALTRPTPPPPPPPPPPPEDDMPTAKEIATALAEVLPTADDIAQSIMGSVVGKDAQGKPITVSRAVYWLATNSVRDGVRDVIQGRIAVEAAIESVPTPLVLDGLAKDLEDTVLRGPDGKITEGSVIGVHLDEPTP